MYKIYKPLPKGVTHAVFDVDQTLYPHSANFQALELEVRLEELVRKILIEHMGPIAEDVFQEKYSSYCRNHGSSAVGLSLELGIDPESVFRRYFKPGAIDYTQLETCTNTRNKLLTLKQQHNLRLSLFTNSTDVHGHQVVAAMGLDGIFGHIFGINNMDYIPKPKEAAFKKLLWELNAPAKNIIFFEDSLSNLSAARQIGFGYNVYIGEKENNIPINEAGVFDLWAHTLPEALEIINTVQNA